MYKNFVKLLKKDCLQDVYPELMNLNNDTFMLDTETSNKDFYKIRFIYAEHVLYSAYMIYGSGFSFNDVLIIYSNMIETYTGILDKNQYDLAVKAAYFLGSFPRNERELVGILKRYLNNNSHKVQSLKLFKWKFNSKDKIEIVNEIGFFKERPEQYKKILEGIKSEKLSMGEARIESSVMVHENIENRLKIKNKYNEDIVAYLNKDLKSINEEFLLGMGETYVTQMRKISLSNVNENEIKKDQEKFKLEDLYTHLAGKTGAGKTVYTDIMIKKLVEEKKRILIITDTVANSEVYKERLEKLGINVCIVVGKNRSAYSNNYIQAKIEEEKLSKTFLNPFMTIIKNKSVVNNLDEFCLQRRWVEDKDFKASIKPMKKCNSCYNPNLKSEEQLYMKCGYYSLYREAFDAEVIVGTAKTLLLSKFPYVFDSKRRTLLEYGVLNSDLIIVDEVDEIQKEFDSAFLDDIKIYSGNAVDQNRNRGDVEKLLKIVDNIDRTSVTEDENVREFKSDVRVLDSVVDVMSKLFLLEGKQDFIRNYIKANQSFNLIVLLEEFYNKYIVKLKDKNNDDMTKEVIKFMYEFFVQDKSLVNIRESQFSILSSMREEMDDEGNIISLDEKIQKVASELFENLNLYTLERIKDKKLKKPLKFKSLAPSKEGTKEERVKNRTNYLVFIMLISLIDFYYKKIRENLNSIVYCVKDSKDNSLSEIVYKYLYKEDIPLIPKSIIESAISGYDFIDERENKNSFLVLRKTNYFGVGREVLFNITKILAVLYNTKPVPIFMASATSIDTKGSMYTIKHKVNRLLENEDQSLEKRLEKEKALLSQLSARERLKKKGTLEKPLSVICHIFNDSKGYCKISGSGKHESDDNIRRLIKKFNKTLLKDLENDLTLYEKKYKLKKGILITVSSHKLAREFYDNLEDKNLKIRVLHTNHTKDKFNPKIHLKITNVESCASFGIDILIAVNKSISRGYNIMDKTNTEAYFRHIIIANRYLPMPSDNLTNVSFIHDHITRQYMKDEKQPDIDFKKLKSVVGKLQIKLKHQTTYSSKEEEVQDMIAGNMFAMLSQIKGRGQRGGASCKIHFLDAAFYEETAKYYSVSKAKDIQKVIKRKSIEVNGEMKEFDDTNSIFNKFISILAKEDTLVKRLFDDMIEAFNNHQLIIHD